LKNNVRKDDHKMSGVVENINNNINVRELPIEIVKISNFRFGAYESEVELTIGDLKAVISEPRHPEHLTGAGSYIYLLGPDWDAETETCNPDWESMVSCEVPDWGVLRGCTDDPRLVDIGRKLYNGEARRNLKPGTIIPPLLEKKNDK
jgi:hypothetical protein